MRCFIGLIGLYLVAALALPLGLMLAKSLQGSKDEFVGLANYVRYFSTPALFQSIGNSLWVSSLSTVITVPLAFVYAYALTRSRMPLRGFFKTVALVPILVPSLLPGIGARLPVRQPGALKGLLFGQQHLRADRHRDGRGLLHLPPRAADHPGRAVPRRRPALRGGGGPARVAAPDLLDASPCPARATA